MATVTVVEPHAPMVLRGVPYSVYVKLRDEERNDKLRMIYYDGTLEIMSPEYIHEVPSRRLGRLVAVVADELGMPYSGVASTTCRRRGVGSRKGKGKEPDQAFYFANAAIIVAKESIDLDSGDPPPDLWIEVDNRGSSRGRIPVYAALGVPEVWRFNSRRKRLWFGRRLDETTYESIDRSMSMPMLTPELVLEALALGDGLLESTWYSHLRRWVHESLPPRPGGND